MAAKCYYLSTCSTCKRIMSEIKLPEDMDLIDIKQRNITADDLDSLAGQLGSYEALFNKRAQKFKALSNGTIELTDKDYRAHILDEYTFLKRPVFIFDDAIFVGNSPSEIEKLKNYLSTKQ